MKSILQKEKICYLCSLEGRLTVKGLHSHHIYGGPNRKISEKNGFKAWLCLRHHTQGPEAVHNNIENMRLLQRRCQEVYEKMHTREEFMAMIGRNFL